MAQLGAPWVLLAFFWGRGARGRLLTAAVLGSAAILLGLLAYVVFKAWAHGYDSVDALLRYRGVYWAAAAVVIGSASGVAGSWSTLTRGTRPAVGFGMLVGTLAAEAMWIPRAFADLNAWPLSIGELVAAGSVLLIALRRCRMVPTLLASVAWTLLGLLAAYAIYVVY